MDVIPLPATDQLQPVPQIRVRTFFIHHERLDELILHKALELLIRDHWRKLGARLATRREDGLLEYHLPRTFEEKYVLFKWTSKQHDQSINTIGLPKATPPEFGITLQPHIETIESQVSPTDWPLEQNIEPSGAPLLYVHLSNFTDGSCIGVNYPHAIADQFGLSNIMKAWLGMTRGENPPPMLGVHNDLLANGKAYTDYRREEVVRKGRMRVRRTGEYPLVILGFIPDMVLRRKEIQHTIFFPLSLIRSLHERHTKKLIEKYGIDPGISHNDIITALLLKFSRMHHKSPRTMALSQSINLRGRIPVLQGNNYNAFIHNSMHYSTARFKLDPSTAVSEIAYQNRQALIQALDPKDAEIGLAVVRELVHRGQKNHTCEPFERSFHVTSWIAAWKGLDFSSAYEAHNSEDRKNRASELLVLGSGCPKGIPMRFAVTVMCKTSEGYWANFAAPMKTVKLLKECLQGDPMLERF